MPYYLSETKPEDTALQKRAWTEVGRYVRSLDPYQHPVTIHPSASARETIEDQTVLDFDMLQTGHGDRTSIPNTIRQVTGSLSKTPRMPVLVGEVCYEGILEASRQELQRFIFALVHLELPDFSMTKCFSPTQRWATSTALSLRGRSAS
jgi:hypothetical protein